MNDLGLSARLPNLDWKWPWNLCETLHTARERRSIMLKPLCGTEASVRAPGAIWITIEVLTKRRREVLRMNLENNYC
jgi:hypothetical protein